MAYLSKDEEIKILKHNVFELQKQLQEALKRIAELKMEVAVEIKEQITKDRSA